MDRDRLPKPGQIYQHFKNKPYQIITIATHAETKEKMVVYQALYGDFKTYIRPLEDFLSEVDRIKYPNVTQKYRFELIGTREPDFKTEEEMYSGMKKVHEEQYIEQDEKAKAEQYAQTEQQEARRDQQEVQKAQIAKPEQKEKQETPIDQPLSVDGISNVLLQFLDAESYYKKLEVITSNRKYMNDRLINDIAVSLDCTVDEGPIDQRIQNLIICLQALCRFEDRRQR